MTANAPHALAVWTPDLDSANGQNIVTRRVVSCHAKQISRVYEYTSGGRSIAATIWMSLSLFLAVLRGRHDGVYVVCSRSSFGFLRDALPLFTSRLGARVIVHVHGSDFPDLLERGAVGHLARWLYASCEVIVPSHHLLEPLAHYAFRRLSVCENFADAGHDCSHSGRRVANVSLVVLWNSNIMASKGIEELVQGIRLLRQEGASIRLILLGKAIGDSEQTTAGIQRYLKELRQKPWINVKGVVPPEDVPRLIYESDVIALPSTYSSECQPLAVIQGMLAGRTLLVSDTPAMRATVGNYPAEFVQRNPRSIAQALRPLVRNHPGPVDFEAASHARDRFSTERFDSCIRRALRWVSR